MKRVAVVGAGTMGNGIAQVFALGGAAVRMIDVAPEALTRGMDTIKGSLARMVKKEKVTQAAADAAVGRIQTGSDLAGAADAELVIEAASENPALKFSLFEQLDRICPQGSHSGHQHQLDFRHRDRGPDPAPGPGDRHALHESGADDAAGGGDPGAGHQRCHHPSGGGRGSRPGQDAGRGQRLSRVRVQPRADAHDQRGHLLRDGAGGLGGGGRHRDEAGHGASDGPAHAGGSDRAGHLPVDPGGAAPRAGRRQVPPLSAAPAHGGGGDSWDGRPGGAFTTTEDGEKGRGQSGKGSCGGPFRPYPQFPCLPI